MAASRSSRHDLNRSVRVSAGGFRLVQSASLLALAGLLGACDDNGVGDGARVSLTFASAVAAQAGAGAALVSDPMTDGTHTLDVQQVGLTFEELVLEHGDVDDEDSEADSDSDGPGNEHVRAGPVTVQLPLDGQPITPFDAPVPNGTYDELEADIVSVRLTGTFDGEAFDVTVPLDFELEADLNPPFVVDADDDRLNLTVVVDVNTLFRRSDGSLIDPRTLETDAAAREVFAERLEAAFEAFEDSDRDADDQDSDSDDGDSED